MGVRPPDWLNHLRFYIVPIGSGSTIARYLSQVDLTYGAMFGSDNWYQLCERVAATAAAVSAVTTVNASALSTTLGDSVMANKSDIVEMVQRIQRYLHAAGPCTQIPIGEAMVNYKDEDSRQIFVPFVSVSISKLIYMKSLLIEKLSTYTGCTHWLLRGPTSLTRSRRERHANWWQYWRATVAEYVQRHTNWKQ